jgi:RNA polymerase sigma-70 factor (ECF subfamily)
MTPDEIALAAFQAGASRWPEFQLSWERFLNRLTGLGGDLSAAGARAEDLFLAFACAEGNGPALATFDELHLSKVALYASRFSLPPHALDELKQTVRVKLLSGTTPGIAQYAGHGPLSAFVRVTTVRAALDLISAKPDDAPTARSELTLSYISSMSNPEADVLKGFYRSGLQALLEEILAGLPARDKVLLRLHLIDRLNVDAIGAILRQHRATIARQLIRVRAEIFKQFQKRSKLRWGTSPSEVRSIVRMLEGEIEVSAARILASA